MCGFVLALLQAKFSFSWWCSTSVKCLFILITRRGWLRSTSTLKRTWCSCFSATRQGIVGNVSADVMNSGRNNIDSSSNTWRTMVKWKDQTEYCIINIHLCSAVWTLKDALHRKTIYKHTHKMTASCFILEDLQLVRLFSGATTYML